MAYAWCALLQQPLLFTPTSIKGSVAAFAASVKTKATGGSGNNSTAAAGGEEGCCKDRDVLYYCKPPSGDQQAADRISIGMFHLPGVHLDGPYHTGTCMCVFVGVEVGGLMGMFMHVGWRLHVCV